MEDFSKPFFFIPRTFRQWAAEFVGALLFALALLFLAITFSPPLPFQSPTCGTGANNPAGIFFAVLFIYLRQKWYRYIEEHPAKEKETTIKSDTP